MKKFLLIYGLLPFLFGAVLALFGINALDSATSALYWKITLPTVIIYVLAMDIIERNWDYVRCGFAYYLFRVMSFITHYFRHMIIGVGILFILSMLLVRLCANMTFWEFILSCIEFILICVLGASISLILFWAICNLISFLEEKVWAPLLRWSYKNGKEWTDIPGSGVLALPENEIRFNTEEDNEVRYNG